MSAFTSTDPGEPDQPVLGNGRHSRDTASNTRGTTTGRGNEESRHSHQQADILSLALEQAINGPPEPPAQMLNATVAIGEGLPALLKRLLQKI